MRILKLSPNILHLKFKSQREMNLTLLRFLEVMEAPYTLESFKKKWLKSHKEWNYPETYGEGYGLDEDHIRHFIRNKYPNPTTKEKKIVAAAKALKLNRYSIICTYGNDKSTYAHELTHAVYHVNRQYSREVDRLIRTYLKETFFLRHVLKKLEYDQSVINDEINAYICDTSIVVPSFYGDRRISLDLTTVIGYHIIEQFIFIRNKYVQELIDAKKDS